MEKENEAKDSLEVVASTSREIQKRNQSENNKMDGEAGEQIRDLDNEELNEALEAFAQNYNLTAQNVKNIIFHIVKNPQTFATLVRKDPDAMAGLRMTRSRLRQLERIAKRQIPSVRLRPISGPKTFLDVNYDENEEEDADYNPGNDRTIGEQNDVEQNEGGKEEEDGDDEDEDGSSYTSETNSSMDEEEEEEEEAGRKTEEEAEKEEAERTVGGAQRLVIVEEEEERRGEAEREAQGAEFLTEVDNPIYPLFIKSVVADDGEMDPNVRQQLYDEDNDPEYVFQEFDEFCEREEKYEFRRDRATEIPRWEVRALEQDFEDEDQGVPTPLDVPVEPLAMTGKGTEPKGTQIGREKTSNTATGLASSTMKMGAETVDHQNDPTEEGEQGKGGPDTAEGESCSLLEQSVRFTEQEIKALKVQLEKHVQLICQTIVGTSHNPAELLGIRNKAVIMLRELDELWQQRGEESMFNVPTLDAAIYTAHDIEACREVNLALKEHHDRQPTNEVMWVLSRSGAVRYPELLCPYRFSVFPQLHSPFLPSEQLLLALGLYQLGGVPHTNRNDVKKGRYPLIQQHFLPNKTVTQIRNHLKNVRSCPSPGIFHKIIMQAEKGSFPVSYRPDLGEKAQPEIPIEWPEQMQPYWLKWIGVLLRESNPQMIMMDENNEQQTEKCSNRDNDEHELDGDNGESTVNANIVVRRMGPKEGGEIDGRSGDHRQPIQSSEKWRILIPTRMTRKRLRSSNGAAEPEEQVRIPVKEELIVRVGEEAVEEGSKRRRRDSSTGGEDGFMVGSSLEEKGKGLAYQVVA